MVTPLQKSSENNLNFNKNISKTEKCLYNELNSNQNIGKQEIKCFKNIKVENDEEENGSFKEKSKKDTNLIFYFEELTEDDDIYTFQCPKNLNIKDIKDLQLSKNNLSERMIVDFIPLKKNLTVAFPSKTFGDCLINVPIQGHMVIKKALEIPKEVAEDSFVDCNWMTKYSEDIKVRHPLLGVAWEAYLKSVKENMEKSKVLERKYKNIRKRKIFDKEHKNLLLKICKPVDKNFSSKSVGTKKREKILIQYKKKSGGKN